MNYMKMTKAQLIEIITKGEANKTNEPVAPTAPTEQTAPAVLSVTNVQVYPFKEGASLGSIKGLANVVLNDQFLVRGLRVMKGENGLFVGYPTDPFYKGDDFRCICQPITRAVREAIEAAVIAKYNIAIATP